jgi:hypothetical protein
VREARAPQWMSNHGLFVGVSALVLALVAKMARRSLTSAMRRAIAKRWSSDVALVLPLGCRRNGFTIANGAWSRVHTRGGATLRGPVRWWPLCEGQRKTKALELKGEIPNTMSPQLKAPFLSSLSTNLLIYLPISLSLSLSGLVVMSNPGYSTKNSNQCEKQSRIKISCTSRSTRPLASHQFTPQCFSQE